MADSKCPVTGKPVSARRYVLCVPLRIVPDDSPIQKGDVAGDGKRWRVPKPGQDEREAGAKFVSLVAELADVVQALDLDPAAYYELRHNPPRKIVTVPAVQLVECDLKAKRARLADGRRVEIVEFLPHAAEHKGPAFRVDYGVLQKFVCRGDQAEPQLALWRTLLVGQLLEG